MSFLPGALNVRIMEFIQARTNSESDYDSLKVARKSSFSTSLEKPKDRFFFAPHPQCARRSVAALVHVASNSPPRPSLSTSEALGHRCLAQRSVRALVHVASNSPPGPSLSTSEALGHRCLAQRSVRALVHVHQTHHLDPVSQHLRHWDIDVLLNVPLVRSFTCHQSHHHDYHHDGRHGISTI